MRRCRERFACVDDVADVFYLLSNGDQSHDDGELNNVEPRVTERSSLDYRAATIPQARRPSTLHYGFRIVTLPAAAKPAH